MNVPLASLKFQSCNRKIALDNNIRASKLLNLKLNILILSLFLLYSKNFVSISSNSSKSLNTYY